MFSKDLEQTIGQCYKRTREARYEFMTVEHLLLALLDNPSAEGVLRAVGADLPRLRDELENAIEVSVSRFADDDGRDTQPTLGFQRVLQRAVYHVQSSGKKEVSGANVLVAIFGEKDSHAVYFLNQQEITRLDVVNYISHGVAKLGGDLPRPDGDQVREGEGEEPGEGGAMGLEELGVDPGEVELAREDPRAGMRPQPVDDGEQAFPGIPEAVWPFARIAVFFVPNKFFRPKPTLLSHRYDKFHNVSASFAFNNFFLNV